MTLHIAMLAYPGFQLLDVAGPIAAFEAANRFRSGAYSVSLRAAKPGAVVCSAGIPMQAQALTAGPEPDTLIVAGGIGVIEACENPALLAWLGAAAGACRVASVCTGAFMLAEAGLLDGKRATTHWAHEAEFARRYPKVALDTRPIYIREGSIWTSAGVTAGIDLALAMIAADLGADIARQCAQRLVVYYQRPGGQSQHSSMLEMQASGGRFSALLDHARQNLAAKLDVEEMAAFCNLSPRHFSRLFQAEAGVPPAKAVERLRVEEARARLESGTSSLQIVARECGFGDAERMRRSFMRTLGVMPSRLKRDAAK
ncbi:GlxA family transcriptional regulator [Chromobacterium sp. IIBBL 290-4]|uniref:GlxA family transcriptional regulator n=1 Tax=Chromobacterium sp. IIBBL 290-4 TaxID=2953890 RepID=UPI0020B708C4|nr:GlxA family transcriptional regulator [Chromobacterium sp. IIBBL 290-4]UTH73777.1 GlxA family transcriptional regulator [Chromobacterium sp. IIBBL 290-4]